MADALSTIAGVGGLIDLAARTSTQVMRLIAEWKDAPKQIYFLSDEINMSQQIAQQLKTLCETLTERNSNQIPGCDLAINLQLNRAKPIWAELGEILQSVRGPVGSKLRKGTWMRKASRVVSLQGKLRDIRFSTIEILGIYNASQSVQTGSAVATYHSNTVAMYEITATSLSDILRTLKEMEPRAHSSTQISPTIEFNSQGGTVSHLDSHSHPQQLIRSSLTCNVPCYCRCHTHKRRHRIRIAPFHSALGSFVLVYSGWTFAAQHCDTQSCLHANLSTVDAKYSMPRWSLDLTILATFRVSYGLPTVGLAVQRIIPHDTFSQFQSIIGFSKMGNCAEIRSLLERRPDAVLDVGEHTGATALDSALRYHQLDACRLLLAAGADPLAEDKLGIPVIAYVPLYRNHRNIALQQEFEKLLPLSSFYDEYEFSHLHQIVLGMRPLDLSSELEGRLCCSQLNQEDKLGYTPLHWAASQGDVTAVRLLLKAGADVDKVNVNGETPLHAACRAGSQACAEALILAGADLHKRLPNGYQPIHTASMAMEGVEILACLLSHNALINDAENYYMATPLALTTLYDRASSCEFLLSQGAEIDQPDWEGDTPMFEGIKSVHGAKCLALFLSNNCNYLHTNFQHQTLLHKVAFLGTAEQVDVLAEADLKGLDPGARDIHNMVAKQYLDARSGISQEHRDAFEKLIEKIGRRNQEHFGDDSDEDIFVDALEF